MTKTILKQIDCYTYIKNKIVKKSDNHKITKLQKGGRNKQKETTPHSDLISAFQCNLKHPLIKNNT